MNPSISQATPNGTTIYGMVGVLGFCHLINDAIQSLLPAIYPDLRADYGLSFGQLGLVTLIYQLTASLLQPVVGMAGDRRPMAMLLPLGTLVSLGGLLILAMARSYGTVLASGALLGVGSSIFHPEASRIARLAAGDRHGLVQSLFQLGGNIGGALGPIAAVIVVGRWGQTSLAAFGLLFLVSIALLWTVGVWYRDRQFSAAARPVMAAAPEPATTGSARFAIVILLVILFSKFVYLASLSSYFTLYLIDRFGVSIRDAQMHLFVFLAAIAAGTLLGGPLGDRIGRRALIRVSILGAVPFALALPLVSLVWTGPLTVVIGLVLASAFPAIIVYGQELVPDRVGTISGLFFGFAFGVGGLGAAGLGWAADWIGIGPVYQICAVLPMIGIVALLLPDPSDAAPARRPTALPPAPLKRA